MLTAIFPAWHNSISADPKQVDAVKSVWAQTLYELGVNNEHMIECGLRACRASGVDFLPQAGKFCKWAWVMAERDAMIPDEQEAIRLVIEKAKGDKRVYSGARYHLISIVSQYLPCANIYGATAEQLTNAAIKARLETVEHWKAGKPFNKHNPVQIEKKKAEPASEEMKNAKWGEIKGIFGGAA